MNPNWNRQLWTSLTLLWTALILLVYWSHHPYYSVFFAQWPNGGLVVTLAVLAFAGWYTVTKLKWKSNGIMLYGFLLFLEAVAYGVYSRDFKVFEDGVSGHLAYFLGFNVLVHAAVLLVGLSHFALGEWLLRPLASRISKGSYPLLSTAIGISCTGLPLLVLGSLGLLKTAFVLPLLVAPLALQYRKVLELLRELFLKPHTLPGKSAWSTAPLFLMFIPMTINLIYALAPYPTGYDGAQLYMNTAHLIAGSGKLPVVGQSFNWELFMSLGEIVFQSPTVSLLLSQLAVLACMFVVYRLGRLFLAREWAWLAAALLYVTPAFAFHASIDAKVDLGFLFIALSILLLYLELSRSQEKPSHELPEKIMVGSLAMPWEAWAWMLTGWMSGYLFGIKYTGLFGMIALMAVHFNRWAGWRGTAGLLLSGIGVLYMGGIHKFAYQDIGNVSPMILGAGLLLPGLALLFWGMYRYKVPAASYLRGPLVFGLMAFLAFAPWMVKHYQENKSFSPAKLVQGGKATPELGPPPVLTPEDRRKGLEVRRVIADFAAVGIQLEPAQEQALRNLVLRSDMASLTLEQRKTFAQDIRTQAADAILRPDQRERWVSRDPEALEVVKEDNARVDEIIQVMTGLFTRRGVDLDESQQAQVQEKVEKLVSSGNADPDDRSWLAEARSEILEEILTEEQRRLFPGMGQRGDRPERFTLSSSQREEIKRYIGYEPGFLLYLSLPYDLTMNTNVRFSRFLDIGFLLLLLLPLLLLGKNTPRNALVVLATALVWLLSVKTLVHNRELPSKQVFDQMMPEWVGKHEGWISELLLPLFSSLQWATLQLSAVLMPVYRSMGQWPFALSLLLMLGVAAAAYAALRNRLGSVPKMRGLLVFMFAFGLTWFIFGNGIVWYGFGFFACLYLVYAWIASDPEFLAGNALAPFVRQWWAAMLGLVMLLGASLPFVSAVQDQSLAQYIFQAPFLKYAGSKQTMDQIYFQFAPYMSETVKLVNSDMNKKVYRVGTFFQYHIKANDRRVLEDNQLGLYSTMTASMEDKSDFIRLLKEKGFGYILYDLNTMSIDRTPDKSLTKKSQEFFMTLARSPMVRAAYTDNFIKDPAVPYTEVGGVKIPGKPGIGGENTLQGRFVVFEIL